MPEMDGTEFIRVYRKEADTPIILLTALLDEADKVVGLELGAGDYVTKPFGMREVTKRIGCHRRSAGPGPSGICIPSGKARRDTWSRNGICAGDSN